jgi:ppGpp synthetase/RelA/SpoT-type nucleotidyltranferase
MAWATTQNSKKAVLRAGELLINPQASAAAISDAMDVLSNWRAAHAYPMQSLLMMLRQISVKVDKKVVVVQRLKRTPSILEKLSRFPEMKLHRMQDISGCRAILNSTQNVELLLDRMKSSRTLHILHRSDDYISKPKDTGYRGIHLVYKYNGQKTAYQDYFVEIQLRSKIQHAWATAVEIVDTFTKQALKSSRGNQDWLDFFKYTGAEFAKLEKRPIGENAAMIDTLAEVKRLVTKLNVIPRLNAFAVSAQHITLKQDNKTDYFLLELKNNASEISVKKYPTNAFQQATEAYLRKEKEAKEDDSYDVVLVAASSMHALRNAYPNYFADSKAFINLIERVLAT